jgi:hypothetical protein
MHRELNDEREIYFSLSGRKRMNKKIEARSSSNSKKKNNSDDFNQNSNFLKKLRAPSPSTFANLNKHNNTHEMFILNEEHMNFDLHKKLENLQTIIKNHQKEIEKLKFVNKFFQVEKKQKELLISKLYDENTVLKTKIFELERKLNKDNNITPIETPTLLSKKTLLFSSQKNQENSSVKNMSILNNMNNFSNFSPRSLFEDAVQTKPKGGNH